jgi:hypothetical protein
MDSTVVKPETSPVTEQTTASSPTPIPPVSSELVANLTPDATAKAEQTASTKAEQSNSSESQDTTPKRVKTELVVSSTIPLPSPTTKPDEKAVAEITDKTLTAKSARSPLPSSEKPLFEPVVITIPKAGGSKAADRPTLEIDRGNNDGRARLVEGQPIQSIEPAPCQINVSQEKLSLLNNGGTLAVLVGVEKGESLADLKYVSSDPDDIFVSFEPDVSGVEGRSLYTITSKSERTGTFRVTFYLPCGKKDVVVTVR